MQHNRIKVLIKKHAGTILFLCAALAAALTTYFQVFGSLELWASDLLYTRTRPVTNQIKIIAIDEKTLQAYGPFGSWSRQTAADLVNALNQGSNKPQLIAFDITYSGEMDPKGDEAFALSAGQAGNVIVASNIQFESKRVTAADGSSYINLLYPQSLELPYPQLAQYVTTGFSNAVQDSDNYIRHSLKNLTYHNETLYSFAYQVYRTHRLGQGESVFVPKTDSNGLFGFAYAAPPSSFETYSYVDVVNGVYDPRMFKDSVVLVGAYVSGMQDQYFVPIARNSVMAGVEIHANIIDALLHEAVYVPVNRLLQAVLSAVIMLLFGAVLIHGRLLWQTVAFAGLTAGYLFLSVFLYRNGLLIYPAALPLWMTLIFVCHIAFSYLNERFRKRRILAAFRKYIAPQVVDSLAQKGEFQIELGGQLKDIAVLFADIRGFTPLSEELSPQEVVELVNEYLTYITAEIFRQNGTLDKYIGDAAMAIFNAPVDLNDYVFQAVLTAVRITEHSAELRQRLKERFGREIGFGLGIHCGKAVVGNIGCEYRMDYTAVGNVVNTAARLESNAGAGQILISEEVYKRLKDRIIVTKIGHIPLKGKQEDILVYQVDRLNNEADK